MKCMLSNAVMKDIVGVGLKEKMSYPDYLWEGHRSERLIRNVISTSKFANSHRLAVHSGIVVER